MVTKATKYSLSTFILAFLFTTVVDAQILSSVEQNNKQNRQRVDAGKPVVLSNSFKCIQEIDESARYCIRLCADVPDNSDPSKMLVGNEPGHVFLVFTKTKGVDSTHIVFGFYPRVPLFCFLFLKVRSKMHDNSNRVYDVCIKKDVSPDVFSILMDKAVELSKRKYHLRKYNCYDYALEVFNSIPGIEKLPVRHLKFSFFIGKVGTPCGLYNDLKELKEKNSYWSNDIIFMADQAPKGCKI